jgi:site-specific recombinase XerC
MDCDRVHCPVRVTAMYVRLVEESDLRAAQELFGATNAATGQLDTMLPKTVKDFEEFSQLLVSR